MTKIWSPTNIAWIINRILVAGDSDLPNVHDIQDKINLIPLSVFEGNTTNTQAAYETTLSSQVPIKPQPAHIPTTGIKLYDELGQAMINNPLNPPDPGLVANLASIGIGPGKIPSVEANDTIKTALQTGIQEGEKLIDAKLENIETVVNGWSVNTQTGIYGNDYLTRAAIAKLGFGANIPQEALYPTTLTDNQGKPYNGANKYAIHFGPGQTPPVDGFWSITMYNEEKYFYDNPLNRYSIGKYTDGLKTNEDGSLDIYIQNQSPDGYKESNWLPSPVDGFYMVLRMYLPTEQVLNGTWTPPPVKVIE
jgi:DNA sulfur modification protein DndE